MAANSVEKLRRIARFLYFKKILLLPKLVTVFSRVIFSCDIPYTADIHPTVIFKHNGLGVVVHKKAIIGKNTKIMQNVTLGGNKGKTRTYKDRELTSPIIGENVFIGPGVSILGPVIVGDNAVIGAGSVVLNDIPSNGIAFGIPAKTTRIQSETEI